MSIKSALHLGSPQDSDSNRSARYQDPLLIRSLAKTSGSKPLSAPSEIGVGVLLVLEG